MKSVLFIVAMLVLPCFSAEHTAAQGIHLNPGETLVPGSIRTIPNQRCPNCRPVYPSYQPDLYPSRPVYPAYPNQPPRYPAYPDNGWYPSTGQPAYRPDYSPLDFYYGRGGDLNRYMGRLHERKTGEEWTNGPLGDFETENGCRDGTCGLDSSAQVADQLLKSLQKHRKNQ